LQLFSLDISTNLDVIIISMAEEEIRKQVEQSTQLAMCCDYCGNYPIEPVHGHFECRKCGYKTKCCEME